MVHQVYFGERANGNVLFDVETYLTEGEYDKELWHSECHVLPCVGGFTRFLQSKKNDEKFNYDEFIDDAKVIQELRGWVHEVNNNRLTPLWGASDRHYNIVVPYVIDILEKFAKKYGLYINVD
jgi:hypothetical protein